MLGFTIPWTLCSAILVLQGAGGDAFEDVFVYGRALATDTPPEPNSPSVWVRWLTGNAAPDGKLPWPFGATDYVTWWGGGAWPFWLFSTIATAGLLRRGLLDRRVMLTVAWAISAWAQVFAPGLYWQHYYMLAAPGAAIVSAVWAARSSARKMQAKSMIVCAGLAISLGWTAYIQARDYLLVKPDEITTRRKGGGQWVALRELGADLRRRSSIWETPTLYNWGWQSPLFVYGEFDSPTKHFFADPLLKSFADSDHSLIRPRIAEIVDDLKRRPPPMVLSGYPPFPELRKFLNERYLPSRSLPSSPNGVGLWIERDRYGEFEASRVLR